MGIPISPHLKDLHIDKVYFKSESGFLRFIILPLFEAANEYSEGDLDDLVGHVKNNMSFFEDAHNKELAKEAAEGNMI